MKLTRLAAAAGIVIAAGVGGVVVAAPATAYPAGEQPTASINRTVFERGQAVIVNVENVQPNATLTMYFQSDPQVLASGAVVEATGTGVITGAIPDDAVLGAHRITVNTSAGNSFVFAIQVVGSGGGGNGGNGGGDNGGGDDNGGLANTGAAVTGIGILGGVLVAGGVFFVVAGRRRTAANHTPSV